MSCDLRHGQRDLFRAAGLGEYESAALMKRDAPAQVRQGERRLSVSAVGSADQLEQRLVLRDRQELTLAEHPAGRGEVPGEHANLANVWLSHACTSFMSADSRWCRCVHSCWRWEDALQGNAETERQERLQVQMCLATSHARD